MTKMVHSVSWFDENAFDVVVADEQKMSDKSFQTVLIHVLFTSPFHHVMSQ
jgi:hypothetical protein